MFLTTPSFCTKWWRREVQYFPLCENYYLFLIKNKCNSQFPHFKNIMGKCKCKIAELDRNKKYKLQQVLDIIMTSDYSNGSSSSDDNFRNDNTFNTNSTDSENSSKGNEVIPPPLTDKDKWKKAMSKIHKACNWKQSQKCGIWNTSNIGYD